LDDQIYLDAPYLSIRWRGVPQILFAEWKGFATSEEFRAALLKGVQAIREHDNHGLSMRKFSSVAAATVWAPSGLGG
jgi:hypothetical protein